MRDLFSCGCSARRACRPIMSAGDAPATHRRGQRKRQSAWLPVQLSLIMPVRVVAINRPAHQAGDGNRGHVPAAAAEVLLIRTGCQQPRKRPSHSRPTSARQRCNAGDNDHWQRDSETLYSGARTHRRHRRTAVRARYASGVRRYDRNSGPHTIASTDARTVRNRRLGRPVSRLSRMEADFSS